ncbi:MAG: hypothetical protein GZ087_00095 [Flavobacterium sp.]|nr:hypothetical protein [Flavobacterium sp.]
MKKIFTIVLLGAFCLVNAQAFKGKGDTKLDIGATLQNGGTGVVASADFGLGENFSIGVLSSYLLGANEYLGEKPSVDYRFDAKLRFNANLGNVLNVSPKFDLYPGLNIGLKNFGGHIGARYFFTDGFGVFTEFSAPFAKYDKEASSRYNNGTSFNIGASFNLD